jgi:hypothetical protein
MIKKQQQCIIQDTTNSTIQSTITNAAAINENVFNELVNFVEIELAWWHSAWAEPSEKAKYKAPFWATGWFRWRTWRCLQAGLDNLKWQSELVWKEDECESGSPNIGKPTPQAEKALEILALYKWWTEVYHQRPDAHDASGWSAYCDAKRDLNEGRLFGSKETPELREQGMLALDKSREIEEAYEKEDEEMMIRLIKIRNGLWT